MNRKVIFVDIDTQIDFMEKEGNLYVESSEEIKENFKKLTKFAIENGILIVASVDAHTKDDPEFLNFPPHCIKGTKGYKKIPETTVEKFLVIPYEKKVDYDIKDFQQIIFEKNKFSIFDNPNFVSFLERFKEYTFFVYGVTTEYCVKSAVVGFLGYSCKVFLIIDAIKAIDEKVASQVLIQLKNQGAKLIKTEEVLKQIGGENG